MNLLLSPVRTENVILGANETFQLELTEVEVNELVVVSKEEIITG